MERKGKDPLAGNRNYQIKKYSTKFITYEFLADFVNDEDELGPDAIELLIGK
jgi:hypothetical protein